MALICVGLSRLLPKESVTALGGRLLGLPAPVLIAAAALLAAVLVLLGYALGVRWIKAKEY